MGDDQMTRIREAFNTFCREMSAVIEKLPQDKVDALRREIHGQPPAKPEPPEQPPRTDYTREELIAICERAIVPEGRWHSSQSVVAQECVGQVWAWLRAGCRFKVLKHCPRGTVDHKSIWVQMQPAGQYGFDGIVIRLPTPARLDEAAGGDWY